MYTYAVGVSRNGRQVYVGIINSAAGRYFSRQPYLIAIAKSIVETLDLTEKECTLTQDMGRNIGHTNVVTTDSKDAIFYARLLKQTQMLRFVKSRSMALSSELSITLNEDNEGNYELTDAWVGSARPPFPNASNATEDSKEYWRTHALTEGSESIDLQSRTRFCPY